MGPSLPARERGRAQRELAEPLCKDRSFLSEQKGPALLLSSTIGAGRRQDKGGSACIGARVARRCAA